MLHACTACVVCRSQLGVWFALCRCQRLVRVVVCCGGLVLGVGGGVCGGGGGFSGGGGVCGWGGVGWGVGVGRERRGDLSGCKSG